MRNNYELELYKLIMIPEEDDPDINYVDEFGWVSDTEFYVWISMCWLREFIERLNEIFGCYLFDDGGMEARIGSDYVCIDLKSALSGYGIDFEKVFPKSKYKH